MPANAEPSIDSNEVGNSIFDNLLQFLNAYCGIFFNSLLKIIFSTDEFEEKAEVPIVVTPDKS